MSLPGPPRPTNALEQLRALRRRRLDPLDSMREDFERYGDVFGHDDGGAGVVHLRHPGHLRAVLEDDDRFVRSSRLFARLLGRSVVTNRGAPWRRQRQRLQRALAQSALATQTARLRHLADEMTASWDDGRTIDAVAEARAFAAQSAAACLCGARLDASQITRLGAAQDTMHTHGLAFEASDPAPATLVERLREARETLVGVADEIIARRRRRPAGDDLLWSMLESGDPEISVRDELITATLMAIEPTAQALARTWHLLATTPRVRARLREALGGAVEAPQDPGARPPLLRQVVSESLRLWPPVYVVPRLVVTPAEVGGFPLRPGTVVMSWIYFAHRDARWFDDPCAFRPERFAAERAISRRAYLPFGAGPRACVGRRLTHLVIETATAAVVAGAALEVPSPDAPRLRLGVTSTFEGALPLRVRRDGP